MRFRGEYYFLSNMFPCEVSLDFGGVNLTFRNAEAAFQAMKCPERATEFVGLEGVDAKRKGRRVQLRADWEEVKNECMHKVVLAKFSQNPGLMSKLWCVAGEIVEDNAHGDTYWGVSGGVGLNTLGRILMSIRDSQGVQSA